MSSYIFFVKDKEHPTFGDSEYLVFNKSDYETIKKAIYAKHPNAFGGPGEYYEDKKNGTVHVKKIPTDLNQIKGWKAIKGPQACGEGKLSDPKTFFNITQEKPALPEDKYTKYRCDQAKDDGSYSGISIHYVENQGKQNPCISTGNMFTDFDFKNPKTKMPGSPSSEEEKQMQSLITGLQELGIIAFPCQNHHAVIFYKGDSGEELTAEKFAEMLQHPQKGDAIREVLTNTSKKDFNVQAWSAFYIETCGKKLENVE